MSFGDLLLAILLVGLIVSIIGIIYIGYNSAVTFIKNPSLSNSYNIPYILFALYIIYYICCIIYDQLKYKYRDYKQMQEIRSEIKNNNL